jgi:hypothetical protein
MTEFRVSFLDRGFIESVTVEAASREEAQEHAIAFWEEQGIVHGELTIAVPARSLPLLPY